MRLISNTNFYVFNFIYLLFLLDAYGFEPCRIAEPHVELVFQQADNKADRASRADRAGRANRAYEASIATWNVRWFPGLSPKETDQHTIDTQVTEVRHHIRELNPWFIFLCEVRDLQALKKLQLNYPALACTHIPRAEDERPDLPLQSLAFMSAIPWKDIWVLDFSDMALTRDRPRRGVLAASFACHDETLLYIYGVHLKSNIGNFNNNIVRRERTMRYILRDWERLGIDPFKDKIIVLGDFNTSVLNKVFDREKTFTMLKERKFKNAYFSSEAHLRLTMKPGKYGQGDVYDYITYSSPLSEFMDRHHTTIDVPDTASDHHMVSQKTEKLYSILKKHSATAK
ncbi:MAG: endonuclease/exonuclease/phosphatase family protein [Verrucomicrobiota bacterium]